MVEHNQLQYKRHVREVMVYSSTRIAFSSSPHPRMIMMIIGPSWHSHSHSHIGIVWKMGRITGITIERRGGG